MSNAIPPHSPSQALTTSRQIGATGAAPRPPRHDFNFSMGDESKRKLDALMTRCNQSDLNLTVARALSLLAWVVDQADEGRVVGSIRYGADALDFCELQERPELLRQRSRPQLVPSAGPIDAGGSSASLAHQVAEPATTAAIPETQQAKPSTPAPAAVSYETTNPKLMPREKVRPKADKTPSRPRGQRLMKHAAYQPGEDGPVKSLAFLRALCEVRHLPAPISFGGRALPGNLNVSHKVQLIEMLDLNIGVTHFALSAQDDFMLFYSYAPRKGWCLLNHVSRRWEKDEQANGGLTWIYSISLAVEYLQRNEAAAPNPAAVEDPAQEVCP